MKSTPRTLRVAMLIGLAFLLSYCKPQVAEPLTQLDELVLEDHSTKVHGGFGYVYVRSSHWTFSEYKLFGDGMAGNDAEIEIVTCDANLPADEYVMSFETCKKKNPGKVGRTTGRKILEDFRQFKSRLLNDKAYLDAYVQMIEEQYGVLLNTYTLLKDNYQTRIAKLTKNLSEQQIKLIQEKRKRNQGAVTLETQNKHDRNMAAAKKATQDQLRKDRFEAHKAVEILRQAKEMLERLKNNPRVTVKDLLDKEERDMEEYWDRMNRSDSYPVSIEVFINKVPHMAAMILGLAVTEKGIPVLDKVSEHLRVVMETNANALKTSTLKSNDPDNIMARMSKDAQSRDARQQAQELDTAKKRVNKGVRLQQTRGKLERHKKFNLLRKGNRDRDDDDRFSSRRSSSRRSSSGISSTHDM